MAALDALASKVTIPPTASVFERVARVNHHLFHELGFEGDTERYDAPENSHLDRVLERRRGLPILLSIITMEVHRRLGTEVDGVGFPGHFLVSLRGADPPFWIDPFHRGRVLREEHLRERLQQMFTERLPSGFGIEPFVERSPNRSVLVRLNNNLKASYLRRHRLPEALRTIDRLIAIASELAQERRDRGLVLAELERHEAATEALHSYLELAPHAADAPRIRALIQELTP